MENKLCLNKTTSLIEGEVSLCGPDLLLSVEEDCETSAFILSDLKF